MSNIRQKLTEQYDAPLLFMDPKEYDKAIIGVSAEFGGRIRVAYDYDKIIEINKKDMSQEDAVEYFEYNQIGSYVGDYTPIFIKRSKNENKNNTRNRSRKTKIPNR